MFFLSFLSHPFPYRLRDTGEFGNACASRLSYTGWFIIFISPRLLARATTKQGNEERCPDQEGEGREGRKEGEWIILPDEILAYENRTTRIIQLYLSFFKKRSHSRFFSLFFFSLLRQYSSASNKIFRRKNLHKKIATTIWKHLFPVSPTFPSRKHWTKSWSKQENCNVPSIHICPT